MNGSKPPLKAHQQENVDWIRRVERGLLADEPGLGKSRSAIEATKGAEKVLIIAPNLVLKTGVWDDEVEMWGYDDTRYITASYHDLNVRKPTGNGTGRRPVKVLDPGVKGHFDAVIVDEAHYIKGIDSKWTWAVKQIARNCDMFLPMTGTPIPNWSHEIFTLLQDIYPEEGKIGNQFGSFWRWAEEWFNVTPNPHNPRAKILHDLKGCTPKCMQRDADDPCEHHVAFARGNFGDRYMRHLRADHLDLPAIVYNDINTPMGLDARRMYQDLKKNFATEVNGNDVLAWSQGAKNVLLDKLTTSPWLLSKDGPPRGGKFELLREDLRNRTRPTLVLAHYRDSVEGAAAVGASVGARTAYIHGGTTDLQNARTVRDFKAGKLDVLVGSLETLAEGLTLTVADTAIFLERSYKPSRNTQATFRIYRMGQEKEVEIRRYLTPNSVDMGKEELLATKNDRAMRTLTAADYLRVA